MSKLSNSDSRTIRHVLEAIDLLIYGAARKLESEYGPDDCQDRSIAVDAMLLHAREELESWYTKHELGDVDEELSADATTLVE